jgi:predicted RNA-binding Zn ribbon-like protein
MAQLLQAVLMELHSHAGIDYHGSLLIDVIRVFAYACYTTGPRVIGQMDFAHYSSEPVDLAVALVNTDQRSVGGGDAIDDLASLGAFLADWRELWRDVAAPPTPEELTTIHEIRATLREVIHSGDEKEASEHLNNLLAKNVATPRVSVHNGQPHLHFDPRYPTITSWLAATTAMGLATVLVEEGLDRFGVCRSSTCEDVYVDASRNRSRLHCTTQCATREAVVAYRKRSES